MTRRWLAALASLALGLALVVPHADAKRIGGGRSVGQQSGMAKKAPVQQPPQQAGQAANNPGAAAAGQPPRNRWLGPIAGLAAGLGLAALASALGLGEAFGTVLLMLLLGVAALVAFRMFMARRQGGNLAMGGAGAGGGGTAQRAQTADFRTAANGGAGGSAGTAVATAATTAVANFDTEQFVRSAKSQFLRLQAAFDKKEIDDLREFTSPAMFAELEREMAQRGDATQVTDVVTLDARFIGVEPFGASKLSEVAGVRFTGLVRESESGEPEAIDEVWNFSRPVDRSSGWVLAGIEQVDDKAPQA
ncbi:MAG: Tim44 domain-containing protein [Lautropia sp.]